jgi:dCTP deaminase
MVHPWTEREFANGMSYGVSFGGYDIRTKQGAVLQPGDCTLLSSIEHLWLPNTIMARVADKSTWARRFITVQNTVIECGWRGHLTLEVVNHSREMVEIEAGDPIAQLLFEQMVASPERTYAGRYQDQPDEPVPALREVRA